MLIRSKLSTCLRLATRSHHHHHQGTRLDYQLVSGIQPTGNIHIGNYFGALKQWVAFQEPDQALLAQLRPKEPAAAASCCEQARYLPPVFQIVDLHSLTTLRDSQQLQRNIHEITAVLLGCGIDPAKCLLFKQSAVPFVGNLCWILATLATVPQLNRFPQYKEKSEAFKEAPVGLFLYPVLQTADILLYRGTHVPIGDDQLAHINLAKHLATKFNTTFKTNIFYAPQELLPSSPGAGRIRSLRSPDKKMSKSEVNQKSRIELLDSPDTVALKVRKAVTDFTSAVTYDVEQRPGVSSLIQIYANCTGLGVEDICNRFAGKDTAQFKIELGDVLAEYLRPIRSRILQLLDEPAYLEQVLAEGARKATLIAEQTIEDVYGIVGANKAGVDLRQQSNLP